MSRETPVRFCEGVRVRFPCATRPVVGFQYEHEADEFLSNLKERMRKFGLEIHPEKTRLIEFGRYAESSPKSCVNSFVSVSFSSS
jgi:hypothetical protein